MKKVMFAGMVLAAGAVNVFADCTTGTVVTFASVLAGQSILAEAPAPSDPEIEADKWHESHCVTVPGTSGRLWKVGAPDPSDGSLNVDPAKEIGTWSVSGSDVTYNYGSSGPYTWTLHKVGPKYFFCDDGKEIASGTLTSLGDCS